MPPVLLKGAFPKVGLWWWHARTQTARTNRAARPAPPSADHVWPNVSAHFRTVPHAPTLRWKNPRGLCASRRIFVAHPQRGCGRMHLSEGRVACISFWNMRFCVPSAATDLPAPPKSKLATRRRLSAPGRRLSAPGRRLSAPELADGFLLVAVLCCAEEDIRFLDRTWKQAIGS